MKKVIVTGANGFIGSSLIKVLVAEGIYVIAVDINFSSSRLPKSPMIRTIESRVDMSLELKIGEGVYDAFYHFAWQGVNGSGKADPYIQLDNIRMGVDCVNICRNLGVKRLLCAGTVAENNVHSLSRLTKAGGGMMYGVAKHACRLILEDYCKNIGVSFVWMQFSNIYGIGNKTGNLVSYTLQEILNGNDATFGPALQPYDFIYIDDLVKAVYCMGNQDMKESFYYIGSGHPMLLKDFLERIGEVVGLRAQIQVGVRPDDGIRYTYEMFDNSNLVEEIGEYVNTDFDNGIKKTADWLKTEIAK